MQLCSVALICLCLSIVIAQHDEMHPNLDDIDDNDESTFVDEDEQPTSSDNKHIEPLAYVTPNVVGSYYFSDAFADVHGIGKKWYKSTAKKDGADENIAKYDGEWLIGMPDKVTLINDYGLIVTSKARHCAIAAKLDRPFKFDAGKPMIMQYEVKYQEGQECGGGYVKLISKGADADLSSFNDKTPYTIMFGPDKCGVSSKVHFIIRYENPKNGTISEHHAKQPTKSMSEYFDDHKTHLYTLIIRPDATYQILVDQTEISSGNLLKDLEPPVMPPKEVEDPEETKPDDWDDREKIADPDAKKPDDWDENAPKEIEDVNAKKPSDWDETEEDLIADPEATKPDDWDTAMDGEWEAPKIKNPKCEGLSGCGKWPVPMITNPAYKGKWKPSKIANPNYKGKWSPKIIANPNYFEPDLPKGLTTVTAIGLELWTMSEKILFDNFLLTDDHSVAIDFAKATFAIKVTQEGLVQKSESGKDGFLSGLISAADERPWLWAVYILTILIPIVLITVFCFSGGKQDKAASHKKTDDPNTAETNNDVEEVADEEEEEEEEVEEEQKKEQVIVSETKKKTGKAALEEDDDEQLSPAPQGSPLRRARQRKQD